MRLRATILCLSMLAVAAPVLAQGQLYLSFDDCMSTARNKDLDCTSTTSTTILIASATPAANVTGVVADEGFIDVVVGSDPLTMPPFWQFQQGGCSGFTRIIFSADFLSYHACADPWQGLANTGGQWGGAGDPTPVGNRARIKWATGVSLDRAFPMAGGSQAYLERVTLRQASNTTCPGCDAPVCAVHIREELSRVNDGGGYETSYVIDGGAMGTEYLTFNDSLDTSQCPAPTPTHNSTWGQVKSLYR